MVWFRRGFRYLACILTGCLLTYYLLQISPVSENKASHPDHWLREHRRSLVKTLLGEDAKVVQKVNAVRICCWIMTSPGNLDTRARFIQMTWGRRCNKTVFISSQANTTFPAIGIDVLEGREHLTEKTLGGYHYVYHHHMDECDWFFKADDDTYLIVENLRRFLADYDTNKPIYFGHHFKQLVNKGYSSGGSGLVLSKEALRRFGRDGHDPKVCRQNGTSGDAALGQCMESLGVNLLNSTDSDGRSTFHCFPPSVHIAGSYPAWYYRFDANGATKGIRSISRYPISFHYVGGQQQLELDFFFYHTRVDISGMQHS